MVSARTKHLLHVCLMIVVVLVFEWIAGGLWMSEVERLKMDMLDPWELYGVLATFILYGLRILTFLAFPQVIFNIMGLVFFNAFPDKVVLKSSPLLAPFICIRVVTRGDFPDLVKKNVNRNLNLCLDVGLENFMMEVVTDRMIPGLSEYQRVREVVVPPSYATKTGALFKARALQYCLEPDVNILSDQDWIVHLDEETILTDNAIRGILNFVYNGKHQFGQGVITYANDQVVNWLTTLADSFRVADDMGKLRAQFYIFHKPYFSWKGSYVVTQCGAERKISFDNGPDGSVAEDCYFGMKAYSQGYSFNFIEGEMWEKSPFTIWDFLQQRKRWMQGIFLVVHSKTLAWRNKLLLAISLYSWITLPLSTSNLVLAKMVPIPCYPLVNFICGLIGAMNIYMYIFGVIKSFSFHRMGAGKMIFFIIGALLTVPFNILVENVAVIWGLFGKKHHFYVVNKELKEQQLTTV
ncbi:unnamed protein product [Orchesella dallaii]|uniref:Glycosyltransferase 2-like domain-containing protein n=1 Tax=Orchesella dallaii TaxID=48710 RepID=A0ABP1Q3Q0_9HEXA